MWAIDEPWHPGRRRLFADTPVALLGGLAIALLGAVVLQRAGALPGRAVGTVAVAAGHGALLATALAWSGAGPRTGPTVVGLLAVAAAAAALLPGGALAYTAVPIFLLLRARRGELTALGLGSPVAWTAVLAGVAVGVFLGGHLLVTASRTLSVRIRLDSASAALAAAAYDVGANVPAAEAFFRGALFNRAQRRFSLPAGMVLSTVAFVARYLVDPLLPKHVELMVGAAFYLTLLSAANCALFWRFGSLVPGGLAALLFFAAYRLLDPS